MRRISGSSSYTRVSRAPGSKVKTNLKKAVDELVANVVGMLVEQRGTC